MKNMGDAKNNVNDKSSMENIDMIKKDKKKIKVVKLGDALEQVQVEQLLEVTGMC